MKNPLSRCVASLVLGCACVASAAANPSLDPREQDIVDAVAARHTEAVALLRASVEINSGTMNLDGVKRVGELLASEFRDIGFATEWVDGAAFHRAGHLVASGGSEGPRVLLIGHLDTVFPADAGFQEWTVLEDGRIRAPGITDMKGGNVVMLEALRALQQAGALDGLQVRAVLTGDEEDRGRPLNVANAALEEAARWADYAIGFEDGDGDTATAVVARRGSSSWQLSTRGRPAHSSQIFREDIGDGAAFEMARILNAWREALAEEENLTFNPGLVMAGTEIRHDSANTRGEAFGKGNVIAQTAVATGGIRALSPQQLERAVAVMREIASNNLNGTQAEFVFDPGYPPMPPTDNNRGLLALYSGASEALGMGEVRAVNPRLAGAADVSFTAPHVRAALDGIGMMGSGGHTVDEAADLNTLLTQSQRAALFLYRLSSSPDAFPSARVQ